MRHPRPTAARKGRRALLSCAPPAVALKRWCSPRPVHLHVISLVRYARVGPQEKGRDGLFQNPAFRALYGISSVALPFVPYLHVISLVALPLVPLKPRLPVCETAARRRSGCLLLARRRPEARGGGFGPPSLSRKTRTVLRHNGPHRLGLCARCGDCPPCTLWPESPGEPARRPKSKRCSTLP